MNADVVANMQMADYLLVQRSTTTLMWKNCVKDQTLTSAKITTEVYG